MGSGQDNARELANFSNNLKRTAQGVKFTRQLFTQPETLTVRATTEALKALGLNIPKELEIAPHVAQVAVSGQAISDGISAGKDVSSLVKSSAASIKILTGFAEANGMIDNDQASVIRIGASTAMIIASSGTDVSSWIALALELSTTIAVKQGLADVHAIQNAMDLYKARVSPQARILGDTFTAFQKKEISIYGVIAKMAVETPDLWPQVITPESPIVQAFPDLQMLPTAGASVLGRGSAEVSGNYPWPASGKYILARWEASKSIDFRTLGKTFTKESAAEFFYELLIKPWVFVYSYANQEITSRGNMSMSNIAALTYLVNPQGEISDEYDYVNMLLGANLTPYDFGDNRLDQIARQFVEENYQSRDKVFNEQAISIGISAANKKWNLYQQDLETMRRKLELVKQNDDISTLVQYPFIYKKLQSYMDFEETSFEKDPSVGGKLNAKFQGGQVRAWRKLHNYFAVMQMLDTFRKDSYLSNTRFAQQLAPFIPSVDQFEMLLSDISYLSTMRSVNRLALKNIASYLDVSPDKLSIVNKTTQGFDEPAKFVIK